MRILTILCVILSLKTVFSTGLSEQFAKLIEDEKFVKKVMNDSQIPITCPAQESVQFKGTVLQKFKFFKQQQRRLKWPF